MKHFCFTPTVDLPLTVITLIGFLVNFHFSAKHNSDDTEIDLMDRLPVARTRIIVFFCGLLTLCWLANLAVWSVFAFIMALSVVFSIVGGQFAGSVLPLIIAAAALREWSFGFPNLILTPPTHRSTSVDAATHELVGQQGITTSPLRPSGDIQIDGKEIPAVSESGKLIETGTAIIVTRFRNNRASVAKVNKP